MKDNAQKMFEKMFNFSVEMTGASIAIVGLLLLITYEFEHASNFTEALKWLRIAHIGVGATISFFICSMLGIFFETTISQRKYMNFVSYSMLFSFALGVGLLIYDLLIIFLETL